MRAMWLAGVAAATFWTCSAAQAPTEASRQASDAEVLSSSELHYSESGGIAGRVHAATLTATGGRVAVSYRPDRSSIADAPLSGTLPAPRYLALWREAERIGGWSLAPERPPAGGADMIEHELRLRLGTRTHQVTWIEGNMEMRDATAFGRRILDAARDVSMNQ